MNEYKCIADSRFFAVSAWSNMEGRGDNSVSHEVSYLRIRMSHRDDLRARDCLVRQNPNGTKSSRRTRFVPAE